MKTRQSIKSIFLLLASALLLTAAGCGKAEGAGTADDKLSLREQGIAYMGAGDYQNAELSFIKALSTSNGIVKQVDLDISYYLGVCEYKLGKPDEAIDTFSAIIGIDDGQEDAYYMRGKVELAKGDKQRAFEDYDRALELEPSRYVLYQKIYMDLCDAGYESEAGSYIGKAVSANEKMSDYQHGIFSYYLGNYKKSPRPSLLRIPWICLGWSPAGGDRTGTSGGNTQRAEQTRTTQSAGNKHGAQQ